MAEPCSGGECRSCLEQLGEEGDGYLLARGKEVQCTGKKQLAGRTKVEVHYWW